MAAAIINSLAPLKVNSTVLATQGLRVSYGIAQSAFRHSGNPYPSVMTIAGAQPTISFQTPFLAAYNLFGVSAAPLKATTFEAYLAKFTDATRAGTLSHAKLALNGSSVGFGYLTGASVDQNGIMMADVTIAFVSDTGMAHPLAYSTASTLPTLASEPTLHSLGPISLDNGSTAIAGESSATIDFGPQTQLRASDGDLYPRVFACLGYDRSLTIQHSDPRSLMSSIGLLGANLTANVIQYFREYDATTQQKKTTGISLTVASGRIIPEALNADNLQVSSMSARVIPLSSTSTDPFTFASGATIPTP